MLNIPFLYILTRTLQSLFYKIAWVPAIASILAIFLSACSLDATLLNASEVLSRKILVTLNSTARDQNNLSAVPFTLSLSEDVSDLNSSMLQVTNGTITNFSGSGSTYTFDVVPTADGLIAVSFAETSLLTVKTNESKSTTSATIAKTIDRVAPSITLASSVGSITSTANIPITAVFSELISGLDISDFAISGAGAAITSINGNGQTYSLMIMALTPGEITIDFPISKVTDLAGNPNHAASAALKITYDPYVPMPTLSSTATSLNNLATIPVNLSFGTTAVTGLSISSFSVINGSLQNFAGSGANYSLDLVPDADGVVSIHLPAGAAENNLGTKNTASNILSFTVDTAPPTLSLSGPTPTGGNSATTFTYNVNYTGASAVTLNTSMLSFAGLGATNCLATVSGNGTAARTISVSGCTGNGPMTLSIAAGSASDNAGNLTTSFGPTSPVNIDNAGPSITLSGPTPLAGNSSTVFNYTVTYSDAASISLAPSHISFQGSAALGCVASVDGSGNVTRTISVTDCSADGMMAISIANNSATDAFGNTADASSASVQAVIDNTSPTLSISSPTPAISNGASDISWTITYAGHDTIHLSNSHITLNGSASVGCLVAVSGVAASTRTVTVSQCTSSGNVGFSISEGSASDAAGNISAAAGPAPSATIDNANFTVSLASTTATINNSSLIPVSVTFSRSTSDFTASDLILSNASVSNFTGSGANYSFQLIPTSDGTISVRIPAAATTDSLGNDNIASNTLSFTVDRVPPTVVLTGPQRTSGNSTTTFIYTATYTGADNITLTAADILLDGPGATLCEATVTNTSAQERTISVTGCNSNGAMTISIAANSANDSAGNQAAEVRPSTSATIDNVAPTLSLSGPTPAIGNSSSSFSYIVTYSGASNIDLTNTDINIAGSATVGCIAAVNTTGTNTREVVVSGCSGNGSMNISISEGTASDEAGNTTTASTTSTNATIDNIAPILTLSAPSVLAGNSSTRFVLTATYAGAGSISLNTSHISFAGTATTGCYASVTSPNATTREIEITGCSGNGQMSLSIAAETAQDNAGNKTPIVTSVSMTIDNIGPSLNLAGPTPALGNNSTEFVWTATYSDASAINLSSVAFNGTDFAGCVATISGTDLLTRTIRVTNCSGNGTVGISIPAGSALDSVGNGSMATTSASATVDNARPTLLISAPSISIGNKDSEFIYTVTYSGADSISLKNSDVTFTGTSSGSCTAAVSETSSSVRTITVTNCASDGPMTLSIAANSAQDLAGNQALAAGPSSSVTIDNTPPTISLQGPAPTIGRSSTNFVVRIIYGNYSLISLTVDNITLTPTGSVTGCTKSLTTTGVDPQLTVTGCTGTGSISFSVAAGTARDAAGNMAPALNAAASATIDNSGPTAPTVTLGTVPLTSYRTPTITHTAASDIGGSTVASYQAQITRTSNGSIVKSWNALTNGTAIQGLSLQLNTMYTIHVRAIDTLGNGGTAATVSWTTPSQVDCVNEPTAPGEACLGGALFAGSWEGSNSSFGGDSYMVTPAGCTDIPADKIGGGSGETAWPNADFTVVCNGTTDSLKKTFTSSGSGGDIKILPNSTSPANSAEDVDFGSVNTAFILQSQIPTANFYMSAALYCDRLVYGGYDDWYLPNRVEMALLHSSRTRLPGFNVNDEPYNEAMYWTSSEFDDLNMWTQHIPQSSQVSTYGPRKNDYEPAFLRCIRRIGPSAPTVSLGTVPTNQNQTPSISFTAPLKKENGTDIDYYEVKIVRVSDGQIARNWLPHTNGTSLNSVILTPGVPYMALVRAIDSNGNIGNEGFASWVPHIDCSGGSVTPGAICPGGAIYLGTLSPGSTTGSGVNRYMVTQSGCGEIPASAQGGGTGRSIWPSADFSPSCSGSDYLTKTWNNGTSVYGNLANLTDFTTSTGAGYGEWNTDDKYGNQNAVEIVAVTADSSGGYHAAARYCDRLFHGGYSDWYLPNRYELNLLYNNRAAIPGLVNYGGYWSSTESSLSASWTHRFADGSQSTRTKNSAEYIRCVRRY